MKSSIIKINKNKILTITGVLFIFVSWIILSYIFNNSLVIPKIQDVIVSLFAMLKTSRIYILVLKLIVHIILTVLISFFVASVLAIISFKSKGFYQFISPIIIIMKTMPIIAIIILLLISMMDIAPYVATSFVIVPIIYEGIISTLNHIDTNITDDLKTITNINLKVILSFYVPLIMPNIMTSLIQSFGLGLKVMVMAEYTSPKNNTFGAEIKRYYDNNSMEQVYAIVLIVILLVFLCDKILKVIREKTYKNI